jgi:hypothetical protein
MNAFFYNESFLSPSEKDSFEEDFLNPILLKDEKEYKQEESKSKCLSPLNNTKSESPNIINMNNEKPTNFMKQKNIWKNIAEKEEEEEEENNENIKSNNNSFIIAKTDYSLPINKEDENSYKNLIFQAQNKSDLNTCIKEFDIDFGKENIILKNREIKENKKSSLPLLLNKEISKSKLIFSVKNDKLNINCGKRKKDALTKKENNENIINNNETNKGELLGKKIKRKKMITSTSNIKVSIKRGPYKRKNLGSIELNLDDKCFPFKSGKGIINITSKFNYEFLQENKNSNNYNNMNNNSSFISNDNFDRNENEVENSNLNLNLNEKNIENCVNDLYLMKFVTKKFFISENGRKKTVKNKRKYKGDIIRKKIKSRFHKSIKNIINENLKKAGSEFFFDFLPQCFIGNTSKKLNKTCLEMTYKELLTTDFYSDLCKTMLNYKNEQIDKNKFNRNKCTLEYLQNNPEISKKSGFDYIKDMKYITLLNNYFISREFEESLHQVKEENEAPEYIQFYIYRAKNYVNFYNNYKFEKKSFESNEIEDDDDYDDDYDEEDD